MLFLLVILFDLPAPAMADVYTVSPSAGLNTVVIEGEIRPGDCEEFIHEIEHGQGRVHYVTIMSPGGDFFEAIRIGRAIRVLELRTLVPSFDQSGGAQCDWLEGPRSPENCTCMSACFFIYAAGVSRLGLYLGVHRPTILPRQYRELDRAEAAALFDELQAVSDEYLTDMGIPTSIKEIVLSTPSDSISVLSEEQVRMHLLGSIPYLDEWLASRCESFTDAERRRQSELTALIRTRSLRASERAELDLLEQRRTEIGDCWSSEMSEARRQAHEEYFGYAPSDVRMYDFGMWKYAPMFLYESFESLARRGFDGERERNGRLAWITWPRSTTQPLAQAFSRGVENPHATSLVVLSHREPSTAFEARVIEEITELHGQPIEANPIAGEWIWLQGSLAMTLSRESSLDDTYLKLDVRYRN